MRISAALIVLIMFVGSPLSAAGTVDGRVTRILERVPPGTAIPAWVFFADRPGQESAVPLTAVAERSIQRRAKVRPSDRLVDQTDLPLHDAYVRQVDALVMRVRQRSRWFNAVSVDATAEQIAACAALPFVTAISPVARFATDPRERETAETPAPETGPPGPVLPASFNYGSSFTQVNQMNVPAVHDLGNYGQGVLVGVFDNGFRLLTHEVFDTLRPRILATYDFVDHKVSVVPNNPSTSFGSHGVNTLSTIGGFKSGQLIGPAFGADYLLVRTENDSSETPVEEDNWLAGIEWADSIGVDVTSTSLGYIDYDSPYISWTWEDMDGNTTLITRAADMAAERGILVVNSAGNEGFNASHNTLGAPADGDSVLSVGAVTSTGTRSSFSSVGPTTSIPPRIKPDVMAQGSSVRVASASNPTGYTSSQGTSFSCPLAAGVAALLVHARPTDGPMEIIAAMKSTASRSGNPDNLYGWGIVNALAALRPAAPAPDAPADGSTGVPTDLTFSWLSAGWADGYRLQAATDSLFATMIADDTTGADTTHPLTGLPAGTKVYWRVRAGNLYGAGPWSAVRSFVTAALPPALAPSVQNPGPGAVNQPLTPLMRWTRVGGAASYRLQIASDSSFGVPVLDDSTLTDTVHTPSPLAHATTYYWRVRGENGAGAGPYSPPSTFTTVVAPPVAAPLPVSPAHGASGLGSVVEFRWTGIQGATSYRMRLAQDSLFTVVLLEDSLLADTTTTASGLLSGRTYHWSVRGGNPGGEGPWSFTASFTLDASSTQGVEVNTGWNLLSVPLVVSDARTTVLFPGAISRAFTFLPGGGYLPVDTLATGAGYWVKFQEADTVSIAGEVILADTIPVTAGWNIIGGLSAPVDTAAVVAVPGGARASGFFAFGGAGYLPASTLLPGSGYWVKAAQDGVLIFRGALTGALRRPVR